MQPHTDLDQAIAAARRAATVHRPTDGAVDGAAPGDPERLADAGAAQMGSLHAGLCDALLSEVRLEVARRIPPARTSHEQAIVACRGWVRSVLHLTGPPQFLLTPLDVQYGLSFGFGCLIRSLELE